MSIYEFLANLLNSDYDFLIFKGISCDLERFDMESSHVIALMSCG